MVCYHVAVAVVVAAAAAAVAAAVVVVAELVPTNEDVRFPKQLSMAISLEGNPWVFLCKGEPDILEQTSRRKDRDSRSILSPPKDCNALVILERLRCSRQSLETNGFSVRFLCRPSTVVRRNI